VKTLKEIIVKTNDSDQRLDRFLKKYLDKASTGFIYKMIRKRNIKLNNSRANPETTIYEGDIIQLYLADETIEKFRSEKKTIKSKISPDIIYEDKNIILINKEVGLLSHGAGGDFTENIVDSMISYLIEKGDYMPRLEKTFTPAICNRLDRNTSGLIIGAKNYESLKLINQALKDQDIGRFYKTIVKGQVDGDFQVEGYLSKDTDKNKVEISKKEGENNKKVITKIKSLKATVEYSLLEIQLITGRTHQIRGHLSSLGHPIIGDRKYGNNETNENFRKIYGLNHQWLHGYRLEFNKLEGILEYLNGRSFTSKVSGKYKKIQDDLFRD